MVSDEFVRQVSEALAELGASSLENQEGQPRGATVIVDLQAIMNTLAFPGVQYDDNPVTNPNAVAQAYVQIPYSILADALGDLQDAVAAASAATTGAGNVNAQLSGMTVTITDREGQSSSVNIGFEIDPSHVYASKAAMKADAANVQPGQFCMIATTDTTASDNATLWSRNSNPATDPDNAFTFLSDLDQASSSAWADWLNNMKPQIESAITTAGQDHTRAESDHGIAAQDHTTASSDHVTAGDDHTTAGQDHTASITATNNANTQAGRAKQWADHPPYIGNGTTGDKNFWYLWSEAQGAYVKGPYAKGDDLDYSTMTPEEIQRLIDNIKEDLVFASIQTCEDIIDELD